MKRSNIILTSAAALVALVAVSGIALMSYAQTTTDTTNTADTTSQAPCGQYGKTLTDEQKAEMEARRTEMEAERAAIRNAISQGFDAWVAAVKQYKGESAPILDEVTADNFNQYAEAQGYMDDAQDLMDKARTIMQEIGIDHPGMGMGKGMGGPGHGGRGGFGGQFGPGAPATDSTAATE
jgi:hypothetical protein